MCNDNNNKINVLPQLAVPSILFKISRTKTNRLVKLDVYGFGHKNMDKPQTFIIYTSADKIINSC
jgi:hypothetical protein